MEAGIFDDGCLGHGHAVHPHGPARVEAAGKRRSRRMLHGFSCGEGGQPAGVRIIGGEGHPTEHMRSSRFARGGIVGRNQALQYQQAGRYTEARNDHAD